MSVGEHNLGSHLIWTGKETYSKGSNVLVQIEMVAEGVIQVKMVRLSECVRWGSQEYAISYRTSM